jgi:DNA ligase-1
VKKHPTLYNIDENGNVRIWYMETNGARYRTVSGIEDGNLVTSAWTDVEGKNIGRSNETTPEMQALTEVEAKYLRKKEQKYSEKKEDAKRTNFLSPMLATSWKNLKDEERKQIANDCWSQPKLDGIRCLISRDSMMSRNGKPIVSCPHILDELRPLFKNNPTLVLDGELYNHELRDNFNKIASLVSKKKVTADELKETEKTVEFHVYDVIGTTFTFSERAGWLLSEEQLYTKSVVWVPSNRVYSVAQLDDEYAQYITEGFEGQMIRLPDALYQHKRSNALIKRKEFFDAEYPVLSIVEGKGNWAGYAKSVECQDPKTKKVFSAGIKGTQEEMKDLALRVRRGDIPKICTVRSPNLTPDGVPRFGIAVTFYDDEDRI